MLVELFLAALALFVWLNAEAGLVRALAYNTMLVAGISTLLFNANPLLRFDGYYILADFLEIPNLRTRSTAYLVYLAERYLFGRRDAERPKRAAASARGSSRSASCRWCIGPRGGRILFFLADRFFLLVCSSGGRGSRVAGHAGGQGAAFLFASPRLRSVRARALAVTPSSSASWAPHRRRAGAVSERDGRRRLDPGRGVRPRRDGSFMERVVAPPGVRVHTGDICSSSLTRLQARVATLAAGCRSSRRATSSRTRRTGSGRNCSRGARYAMQLLARARERAAELTVRSERTDVRGDSSRGSTGTVVRQGDLLAHVVDLGTITVRAVVSQPTSTSCASARAGRRPARRALSDVIPAVVRRMVPGGSERLPATTLGSEGGGQIAVDPRDRQA